MSAAGGFLPRILGHERPKAFFRGVLANGRIPSGFLLHGGRGLGKATFAMEILKLLHCGDRVVGACGRCPSCVKFDAGYHPDLEVVGVPEGKTRIPIDRLRELKEWFSLAPFESSRRTAIIDDAQAMGEETQNSLLKLLEEPPGRGLLILVTVDVGALLETILSRVQRIYFGPLGREMIEPFARTQGVAASDLTAVWDLAEGAPGRALSMATDESVRQILALVPKIFESTTPFARVESLLAGKKGGAPERERMALLLDAALTRVERHLGAAITGRDLGPERIDSLAELPPGALEEIMVSIGEARSMTRSNVGGRLVLDTLLIRIQRKMAAARRAAATR